MVQNSEIYYIYTINMTLLLMSFSLRLRLICERHIAIDSNLKTVDRWSSYQNRQFVRSDWKKIKFVNRFYTFVYKNVMKLVTWT